MEYRLFFGKESHLGASYTIKAGIAAMQKQATYLLFDGGGSAGTFQRKCQVSYEGIWGVGYWFRLHNRKDQPETLSLCCHGIPGNPCMFHESLIPELLQLTGDQGGRKF